MEFRILGALEVEVDGQVLALQGRIQRALLAVLLLHVNEVVSTDRLMDALWSDGPPESGANALQVRVSQLRKALGQIGTAIETRPTGYALRAGPEQLDLHRFEQLASEAERCDPPLAAAKLREALSIWRGTALSDFVYDEFAQPAIARLEELRLAALERRIEADLELGRDGELVGELEALVVEHPLRERFLGQLMLALYRSGRQAEALASYTSSRDKSIEQLGIEPSPALQALQRAILRQDEQLALQKMSASERSVLVVARDASRLDAIVAAGELLCKRPPKELIIARAIADESDLGPTAQLLNTHRESLIARSVLARTAAFVSDAPGADLVRLAVDHDVDLVIVDGSAALLEDETVGMLMAQLPCDVAVLGGGELRAGPVVVPFVGAEHDWAAIELAAWAAGAAGTTLRILGAQGDREVGRRDASRLLANASIAVQRILGVAAEPLLVKPVPAELVRATESAGLVVVGLSGRWRTEGLGDVRMALATQPHIATLLVRRGIRPGGLAPKEQLTRFTWSIAPTV